MSETTSLTAIQFCVRRRRAVVTSAGEILVGPILVVTFTIVFLFSDNAITEEDEAAVTVGGTAHTLFSERPCLSNVTDFDDTI